MSSNIYSIWNEISERWSYPYVARNDEEASYIAYGILRGESSLDRLQLFQVGEFFDNIPPKPHFDDESPFGFILPKLISSGLEIFAKFYPDEKVKQKLMEATEDAE